MARQPRLSRDGAVATARYLARQVEVGGGLGCGPDELIEMAWALLPHDEAVRLETLLTPPKEEP